ncbi:MAG: hypothetical protein A4E64_01582 [Syntrophorhabdus sp. PtaU1.Bin058]|nr:MAG: hypothetical protein A4E64_01582 [Syntrophorhabdus sp. PtaU1.Bin058]
MTERRQMNFKLIVWLSAALVLIGTGFNAVPSFAETIHYTYDDLNRLTAMEDPNTGGVLYEYDEVGNRLSKSFVFKAWPLNVVLNDTAGGMVTSTNEDIYCGSSCLATYSYGTLVTLIATPDTSYNFTGWSGACTGTGDCTITMDSSKNVTANFSKKTFTINASSSPDENGISPSGRIEVQYGDNITFTIGSKAGYTLADVKVDGVSIGAATNYIFYKVISDHVMTAVYACTGPVCPSGFTLEGGTCHRLAGCPGGTLDAQYDLCVHDILFICPSGYTYVPEQSRCEAPPVCSAGSYDTSRDRCQKPVNKRCHDGYIYAVTQDRCEAAPSCPAGGLYSTANNRCEAACTYSYICSLDDTESGGWSNGHTYADYDTCANNCSQTTACTSKPDPVSGSEVYTCPYGAENTCDGSHNCTRTGSCSAKIPCNCPIGYSWNGAICVARATCSQGNFDGDNDVCYHSYIPSCDTGWSFAIGSGASGCSQKASCPSGGTLSTKYDTCYTDSTTDCGSGYTWDPDISRCRMSPQCPTGSYSTTSDRCETAAISCP